MRIQHTCKFCSAPVFLEMDESGVKYFGLDFWKSLAACNRCADFMERKRTLIDRLLRYSVQWTRNENGQLPLGPQALERLKNSIIISTKKYAELVCRFHRINFLWQEDFAQQIMDMPHKAMQILLFYERGIAKAKQFPAP